jgi:hypothetical protein
MFTYSKPLPYCRPPVGEDQNDVPTHDQAGQLLALTVDQPTPYIHNLKHFLMKLNADGMQAVACDGAVRNKCVGLYLYSGGTRFESEFGDRLS